MWVGLALNSHSCPSVGDDFDVSNMDVLVGLDEVGSQDGSEQLGRSDWVLLRNNVGGILHGVCCDDGAVVCIGVAVE